MPDERETALNEAYQARYGVPGPYADKAIISEGQAAHHFFDAGVAFSESSREAAEAEVEHLRTGLRERGFIVGRNPDGVDDTAASALLIVDDFKAENGRLREALTNIQGESYLALLVGHEDGEVPDPITALKNINDLSRAALSPREDGER